MGHTPFFSFNGDYHAPSYPPQNKYANRPEQLPAVSAAMQMPYAFPPFAAPMYFPAVYTHPHPYQYPQQYPYFPTATTNTTPSFNKQQHSAHFQPLPAPMPMHNYPPPYHQYYPYYPCYPPPCHNFQQPNLHSLHNISN